MTYKPTTYYPLDRDWIYWIENSHHIDMGLAFATASLKNISGATDAQKDLKAFVVEHSSGITGPYKAYE